MNDTYAASLVSALQNISYSLNSIQEEIAMLRRVIEAKR
jgi:hypothetical protein